MIDPKRLEELAEEYFQMTEFHPEEGSILIDKAFIAGYQRGHADCLKEMAEIHSVLQDALNWADEMFTARDEMNSKVHCAPVRLSPITERVKQAKAALAKIRGAQSPAPRDSEEGGK